MRSLFKLVLLGSAIVLLVIYRVDIGNELSGLWANVSPPPGGPNPIQQSAQNAGAAVNSVMSGVGHAFGH